MLTKNLTPSGRLLNWVSSLTRGGSSAWRSLRRARRSIVEIGRRVQLVDRRLHGVLHHVEVLGEHSQEPFAPVRIQREIGFAERCSAGTRGHLAAARVEAVAHLPAQPFAVVLGQIRPAGGCFGVILGAGDVLPAIAQRAQRLSQEVAAVFRPGREP